MLSQDDHLIRADGGAVAFTSDAPLELIQASSGQLRSIINTSRNEFGFSVQVSTFEGFNSPLQREHFNENYLESASYPAITFVGRIIEKVDFSVDGSYEVRAKGKLNVHGIERERIIDGHVAIEKGIIGITADFNVLLSEHNISIPRLVYQKIAEEIRVHMSAQLHNKGS